MPFLPTPWCIAQKLHGWGKGEVLDLPEFSDDLRVIHGSLTIDSHPRLEISPRIATLNRRTFGYVCDITAPTNVLK